MKHKTFFFSTSTTLGSSGLRLRIFYLTFILLLAAFGFNPSKAQAQTYAEKTLHSFSGISGVQAALINVNGILYGMTPYGGSAAEGTIFSVNADGTGFQTRYSFQATSSTDGSFPQAGLIAVNGLLYGTTYFGGSTNGGTIFSFDPATNTEKTLYTFQATSSTDGVCPDASLISVNGILYGTTIYGGTSNAGTVFAFDPSINTETTLYSFTDSNGDGKLPRASLLAVNGLLYGTTEQGGILEDGIVFSLDPSTGVEHILHQFTGTTINMDGSYPESGLILLNNVLYGTTSVGGIDGDRDSYGTVYALTLNGNRYYTLYAFTGTLGDGAHPCSGLIAVNGLLYGTTAYGGSGDGILGNGTVFAIDPSTGDEDFVYDFSDFDSNGYNADGATPFGGLVAINGILYGTTEYGGTSRAGTIFSLTPVTIPVAHNDACTVKYNTTRTNASPGVLANDNTGGDPNCSITVISSTTHGSLWYLTNGGFSYTPNEGYVGTDSFTYQAVNSAGYSNTATCTLTVIPILPTAKNDACTIAHNKARTNAAPGVLGNDNNGGAAITAALISKPTHGTLTLSNNGAFTYTPNTGYSGTDTFTYQAVNSVGKSNIATVTLTVQ